ncbi:MAG TPA: hypothetical protein VIM85_12275, partial [Pseudomonadales bacterium]
MAEASNLRVWAEFAGELETLSHPVREKQAKRAAKQTKFKAKVIVLIILFLLLTKSGWASSLSLA